MGDHHELDIDSAILDMRKYWDLPDVYEFDTEVREVNDQAIRLETNYFYPEGGGQPADKGKIIASGSSYDVVDVQDLDEIVWITVPKHNLEEGMKISAKIDQERRETLTRNHSAQHLVSAVFWEDFGYETFRALMETNITEVEFDKSPDFDSLLKGMNHIEELITSDLEIKSEIYGLDQLKVLKYRGNLPENHKIYRIVKIGDIDLNACGGTHLRRTAEIGSIALEKIDGKRIKFTTGELARKYNSAKMVEYHELAKILGMPLDEVKDEVNRILHQNTNLHKEIQNLENQLLISELTQVEFLSFGNFKLASLVVNNLDRAIIVDQFSDIEKNAIVLVENYDQGFVLHSGDAELTTDIISSLREKGVKGGGRGNTVMGKSGGVELVQAVRNILNQIS